MTLPPKSPGAPLPPLEIPPGLETKYVNLVRIAHSPSDITFDFALISPGGGPAKVVSRIVMSPLGAKLFHRALTDNLAKFEATFGQIVVPGETTLADDLFHPHNPPNP